MKLNAQAAAFDSAKTAALAIAVLGAVALGSAWFFQLVIGIQPCPLCLEQRYAYYFSTPLASLVVFGASRRIHWSVLAVCLLAIMVASLGNAGLGVYHAGVEWKLWQGPNDCSGPLLSIGSAENLLASLEKAKVVRCDEVQWRFLGLSLAGYSVAVSLLMSTFASVGFLRVIRNRPR